MPGPQDFHFLVLPEFSFLAFISAIEPLRVANHFRPDSYRWHVLSCDGAPVVATNGMVLNPESSFTEARGVERLFVVSGFNTLSYYRPELGAWLRGLQRRGATLGAIDGGAFVLAEAGVLRETPTALHWASHAPFAERYPAQPLSEALFEINERHVSCAGGTATIDLMLALITQAHGLDLATRISDWIILGRIRSKAHYQRMEIATRYNLHNDKTIQIIKRMQEHVEDPLSVDDLAAMVGVTRRQLERLFRSHLDVAPSQFYLGVRLDRAHELLQQTGMAITSVAVACGFGSSSYFARAYRARFGISPKEDRIEAPAQRRARTTASRYDHPQ